MTHCHADHVSKSKFLEGSGASPEFPPYNSSKRGMFVWPLSSCNTCPAYSLKAIPSLQGHRCPAPTYTSMGLLTSTSVDIIPPTHESFNRFLFMTESQDRQRITPQTNLVKPHVGTKYTKTSQILPSTLYPPKKQNGFPKFCPRKISLARAQI